MKGTFFFVVAIVVPLSIVASQTVAKEKKGLRHSAPSQPTQFEKVPLPLRMPGADACGYVPGEFRNPAPFIEQFGVVHKICI